MDSVRLNTRALYPGRSKWDAENAKSQQEWSGGDDAGDAGNAGGNLLKQLGLPAGLEHALEEVPPSPGSGRKSYAPFNTEFLRFNTFKNEPE